MDKRFLNAFLTPSATIVEGYRLRPWCLKHRIWLTGVGSPFMAEDQEIGISDLLLALRICAERPIDKLSLRERWLARSLSRDPARFRRACLSLHGHMDGSETWPRFWKKTDEGEGESSTPWPLLVLCNLIRHGVSYEHALQMPEPRAIWMSAAFAIADGSKLEFLSSEMEAEIDAFLLSSRQSERKPNV